ncbi:MAG: histidine kinase, partial [Sphingobacteriales bacterium]
MNTETLSEKLHTNTSLRIASHFLFWTIMLAIGWYNTLISFNNYNKFDNESILLLNLSGIIGQTLVYYPLVYFVLPQYFQKRKYLQGAGIVLILILFYTLLNALSESFILLNCESCMQILNKTGTGYYVFLHKSLSNRMLNKLLSFGIVFGLIFSICIPVSIKFALQAFRQQLQAVKLAKQNVELEFSFLKSQVNPHFLFNSLNNIYGLILRNDNQKAANIVARLAE